MSIFSTQGASANNTPYYMGPSASTSTSAYRSASGNFYGTNSPVPASKSSSPISTAMNALYISSSLMGFSQTISQAIALRTMAKVQKSAFQINQKFAEMQATDAIKRGDRASTLHAQKVKKLIGTQRAALASQGVEVNSDSALDIQTETAEFGAIDMETIRNNAYREAWGYKVQALDLGTKGEMAYLSNVNQARNTLLTGGLNTLNLGLDYYRTKSLEDYLT